MPGFTLRGDNMAFWLDLRGGFELGGVITCDTRCMKICSSTLSSAIPVFDQDISLHLYCDLEFRSGLTYDR